MSERVKGLFVSWTFEKTVAVCSLFLTICGWVWFLAVKNQAVLAVQEDVRHIQLDGSPFAKETRWKVESLQRDVARLEAASVKADASINQINTTLATLTAQMAQQDKKLDMVLELLKQRP